MPLYIFIVMRNKFNPGDLIFTGKNVSDLYILNSSGGKIFKLTQGTALIVADASHIEFPYTKVGSKQIPVELDLDCWIPVFYCGFLGWIYYEDINNEQSNNRNWKHFQALYYFLYSK
jgi:hypothetical protein